MPLPSGHATPEPPSGELSALRFRSQLPALLPDSGPVLVFDGGCIFCRRFAELSERGSGIAGLLIRDGRSDHDLRRQLARAGYQLREGAMVLVDGRLLHGAEAIQWLCARMAPSAALLRFLAPLLATPRRARQLYPLLLLARRAALALRRLPLDPDDSGDPGA